MAISTVALRDASYAGARLLDPEQKGARTDQIYGRLASWRIPIGGPDPAARVRRAMASDPRFDRIGPATYRWK